MKFEREGMEHLLATLTTYGFAAIAVREEGVVVLPMLEVLELTKAAEIEIKLNSRRPRKQLALTKGGQ